MVLILDDGEMAVEEAARMLEEGGVIIYPTDTVYGIGCDGTSENAVAKIRAVKGVAAGKPFSVMMADLGMIREYCEVGAKEEAELVKKLPGPYTFLLKKRKKIAANNYEEKLGVRIPDNEFCQLLCKRFNKPIVTTSANITKQNPPTALEETSRQILEAVDLAIDGGKTRYKKASQIIDLVENKRIR